MTRSPKPKSIPNPNPHPNPQTSGALILVATPIGNLGDLSSRAIDTLRDADVIAAEDTRRTRGLLTHFGISAGGRLKSVRAQNESTSATWICDLVAHGKRVVYVSDAGTPGISDPGEFLVRACLDAGLSVEQVPGPSAVIAALTISGLPTGRFAFEGFLARRGRERKDRLATISAHDYTTVIYESPRRIVATLEDLAAACGDDRPVAVARELTKLFEECWRGTLREAVAYASGIEQRGEYVIVVAPSPPPGPPSQGEVEVAVAALVAQGHSAREIATLISSQLGVRKQVAYEAAVAALRMKSGSV